MVQLLLKRCSVLLNSYPTSLEQDAEVLAMYRDSRSGTIDKQAADGEGHHSRQQTLKGQQDSTSHHLEGRAASSNRSSITIEDPVTSVLKAASAISHPAYTSGNLDHLMPLATTRRTPDPSVLKYRMGKKLILQKLLSKFKLRI
jgi:hypothetical protein